MNAMSFLQILQGPFNFLRPDADEVRRLMPDLQRVLPMPRPVFLEDESATPLQGFPILLSPGAHELSVVKDGYKPMTKPFRINAGERKPYIIRLER